MCLGKATWFNCSFLPCVNCKVESGAGDCERLLISAAARLLANINYLEGCSV